MDSCDYGCGQEAKFLFGNGKRCCSKHYRSCPFQATLIGKTRIGKTHSSETKRKIGIQSKERIKQNGGSFFKGKNHTEQTKQSISKKNKGKRAWNKGKTKHSDESIASSALKNSDGRTANKGKNNGMFGKTHSDHVKEKQRLKNISEKKWQGSSNPWYGKDRSGTNSPRFMTDADRSKWEVYKQAIRTATEKTYRKYKSEINPNNLNRGTKEFHLDHIVPIWYGFTNNIDPRVLSLKDNLRIVWWSDNLGRHKTIITEEEKSLLHNLLGQV